jgi:23S rRNA (uracil1939-C5)-methyltransferase
MTVGDRLELEIERPAAGGRMIGRHEGAIVLVSGCIPGEVVEVEIEKVQRGTAWARTVRVMQPSPDRVRGDRDLTCGGNVLAHVTYRRQLELKAAIVTDAFARIGRMSLPSAVDVQASPAAGYRMRARLHVVKDRIGFYREGTHELCDAAVTEQLMPQSIDVLRSLERSLNAGLASRIKEVELAENCAASEPCI